jgi:hypothetical protein
VAIADLRLTSRSIRPIDNRQSKIGNPFVLLLLVGLGVLLEERQVLLVALFPELVDRDEAQRRGVDAVAEPSGCGPSAKTCPRCESALSERTSLPYIALGEPPAPLTLPGSSGLVKLGQPVPESYLSIEANSGSPETTST